VVIHDEPMSGLDPIRRKMGFELVMELRERGKTIFFCSHILSDVERLCDRIGVMVQGRLARVLERGEFFEDPDRTIHLLLPRLSEEQQQVLGSLPCFLTLEQGGTVLSAAPPDLSLITEALRGQRIDIRASRSGRLSLEDLFMTIVEGQRI
jgi:ABC-2 type transport system ATP-binding protein